MPVTRIAGTLCPAALTWRKNSRPLVPGLRLLVQDDQVDPALGDPVRSPSSAVAAVATA